MTYNDAIIDPSRLVVSESAKSSAGQDRYINQDVNVGHLFLQLWSHVLSTFTLFVLCIFYSFFTV